MSLTYRKLIKLDEQLLKIDQFADEAQRRIDFESAHDDEILAGIKIVEDFLRVTGRICYGGTAQNIQLPKKYKFYDPEMTIPDYDFLTPNGAQDVKELERRLRSAGFVDIGSRAGVHEGTTKIYLNFVPIADITEIDEKLYNLFKKHAITDKGITYMDINSLRMMMYLELSRPKGEVSRWHKVYERLKLLEHADIPRNCKAPSVKKIRIPLGLYRSIFYYALNNERVMAGASVLNLYKQSLKETVSGENLINANLPIVFYSPSINSDIVDIKQLIGNGGKITEIESIGDFIPRLVIFELDGRPVLLIVEETACHAYNMLQMHRTGSVKIASLDTIITLYLSLMLTNRPLVRKIFPQSILCMAQTAMEISSYLRRNIKRGQFPLISLECSGHQVGLPTLLKERFKRIRKGSIKTASYKSTKKISKTRKVNKKSAPIRSI
jgi:hypothetical protein